MRLRFELVVERPRDEVWGAYDDPQNLAKWQPTLRASGVQSGRQGQVGAVSRLVYEEEGRRILMLETITGRREPESMSATYDTSMLANHLWLGFEPLDEARTRMSIDAEIRFKGLRMPLGFFLGKSVSRRLRADFERFKLLLEAREIGPRPPDPAGEAPVQDISPRSPGEPGGFGG